MSVLRYRRLSVPAERCAVVARQYVIIADYIEWAEEAVPGPVDREWLERAAWLRASAEKWGDAALCAELGRPVGALWYD